MPEASQMTTEQRAGVYQHDTNLVVVAGAGSGKTFVLVERYLALLGQDHDLPDGGASPWSLVAVTFTEKAAREMRDRVRSGAQQRALRARERGDQSEAQRWHQHEAALDGARISTIHSLCSALLRRFPAEAAVDPRFTVLEEVDATLLARETARETLAELAATGGDEIALLPSCGVGTVRTALASLIEGGILVKDRMTEMPDTAEDILQAWRLEQSHRWRMARERLLANDDWRRASHWARSCQASDPTDALERGRALAEHHLALAMVDDLAEALPALEGLRKISLSGGRHAAWGGKEGIAEAKANLRALRTCATAALEATGPALGEADEKAARLLILWRRLYARARESYAARKEARGALDFDDLESGARKLLDSNASLAARVRAEIDHLMVDEFQDTSKIQREIVDLLTPPAEQGRLFVVGDPKQSIYRFRGADVSLFRAIQRDLPAQGGNAIALSESFRAHTGLVMACNDIFGHILGHDVEHQYEVPLGPPMHSRRTRTDQSPCIELFLVPKKTTVAEAATGEELVVEIDAEESREWQAHALVQRLRALLDSGYQVWDKRARAYRPMRYDDVAVLFRASTGFAAYEKVYKEAGLPYVTVGGRGYFGRQEIWDLLNLLQALHNPCDDLALASALRSPLFALSDEALLVLRTAAGEADERGAGAEGGNAGEEDGTRSRRPAPARSLFAALEEAAASPETVPPQDRSAVSFAAAVLRRLRASSPRASLLETLQAALSETQFLATLAALPDGERRRGNVEKLLALARQHSGESLQTFVDRVKELRDEEVREGEALVDVENAVRLITVHSAKGLEFPVVVIADASSAGKAHAVEGPLVAHPGLGFACRFRDPEKDEWIEPAHWGWASGLEQAMDEAEGKRLLYVAATRAQDLLIVTGQLKVTSASSPTAAPDSWLTLLVNALGANEEIEQAETDGVTVISRPWGLVALHRLTRRPTTSPADRERGAAVGPEEHAPADPAAGSFPLAEPIDEATLPFVLDVTATHLTRSQQESPDAVVRQAGIGMAIRTVAREHKRPYIPRRMVGEITHRALRHWRLPRGTPDLASILQAYAWNLGLMEPDAAEEAAAEALRLLERFTHSDLYREMEDAAASRRHEVPFLLRRAKGLVRGIMDAVYQRRDGGWVVVEFKTDYVSGDDAMIEAHARGHYLVQVGTYAEALKTIVGQPPEVSLHFLRHDHTCRFSEASWQERLTQIGW